MIMTFIYNNTHFYFDYFTQEYYLLNLSIDCKYSDILNNHLEGLTENQSLLIRKIIGENLIEIKIDSVFTYILDELCEVYILYDIFVIIFYIFLEPYYIYAIFLTTTVVISIVVVVYSKISNLNNIKSSSEYKFKYKKFIKKDSENSSNSSEKFNYDLVCSTYLTVGDIVEIDSDSFDNFLPFDAYILSGTAIVNENDFNGNKTPVMKIDCSDLNELNESKVKSNRKIFLGSRILYINKKHENSNTDFETNNMIINMNNCNNITNSNKLLCMISSTGYQTEKGKNIKNTLHHTQEFYFFTYEICIYLFAMIIISIIVYICSIQYSKDIALDFFNYIVTGVSPFLLVVLSLGLGVALNNLKMKSIICVNENKINISSQVNRAIFDKTGILHSNELEEHKIIGVNIINNGLYLKEYNSNQDSQLFKFYKHQSNIDYINDFNSTLTIKSFKEKLNGAEVINDNTIDTDECNLIYESLLEECIITCNRLHFENELLGDSFDKALFYNKGFKILSEKEKNEIITDMKLDQSYNNIINIIENLKSFKRLAKIKIFDYEESNKCVTVVNTCISELKTSKKYKIFSKGEVEVILKNCKERSLPSNIKECINLYKAKGYKIFALSFKLCSITDIQNLNRIDAEKDMNFLGLCIMGIKLFHDTLFEISNLKNAGINICISSGDNIETNCHISNLLGISDENLKIARINFSSENLIVENLISSKDESKFNYSPYQNMGTNILNKNDNLDNNLNIKDLFRLEYHDKNIIGNKEENETNMEEDLVEIFDLIKLENNIYEKLDELYNHPEFSKMNFAIDGKTLEFLIKLLFINIEELKFKTENDKSNLEMYRMNILQNSYKIMKLPKFFKKYGEFNEFLNFLISNKEYEMIEQLTLIKTEEDLKTYNRYILIKNFLNKTSIYANLNSYHKYLLTEFYKSVNSETTIMCGEGLNSMDALRNADIGMSFTNNSSSFVSHFVSSTHSISSVKDLIMEGKLAVSNSLDYFKFIIEYSFLQIISQYYQLKYSQYNNNEQSILQDIFLLFFFNIFFFITPCETTLSKKRPIISVTSKEVIFSIISKVLLNCFIFYNSIFLIEFYSKYINSTAYRYKIDKDIYKVRD